MLKFEDFKYERVNVEEYKNNAEQLTKKLEAAQTFEDSDQAFNQFNQAFSSVMTNYELAFIRHSINTADKFYDEERNYWDENFPLITASNTKFYKQLLNSPFLNEFKNKYPKTYFLQLENELKVFDEKIINELQEENKLTSTYSKLIASAIIYFDNKELTISQIRPYLSNPDQEVRKSAYAALSKFINDNLEKFDQIFDELVKVRHKIATKLGYKNFIEVGYLRNQRLDYNQEMVEVYRKQILDTVVPIVQKIRQKQAKRLNIDKTHIYDINLTYLNGNPKPIGSFDDTLLAAKEMYEEMSPEIGDFFNLMINKNLLDLISKPNKQNGGYMTMIYNYKVPFIFSNFNGTTDDVDVLTHETGHAFQGYMSRDIYPNDCIMPTSESCEIHSMSMEFIAWPYMEKFFGKDADKYRYKHLSSAVEFLPYGVAVDHFQHEVYANPELTPAQRRDLWAKLDSMYRPDIAWEDENDIRKGFRWLVQGHIFESPFYYIDYTLAQVCAFQFLKRSQFDHDPTYWQDYMNICKIGGQMTFGEICQLGNLVSPFKPGSLNQTMAAIDNWLDNVDDSKL